jgi:hypothetical protein
MSGRPRPIAGYPSAVDAYLAVAAAGLSCAAIAARLGVPVEVVWNARKVVQRRAKRPRRSPPDRPAKARDPDAGAVGNPPPRIGADDPLLGSLRRAYPAGDPSRPLAHLVKGDLA